ncbi:MAG TPA: M15 family metallopeptidase [Actinomycetota bacterium]|nr:M15 family metallopeptidase [Actinomycetota bacterium]
MEATTDPVPRVPRRRVSERRQERALRRVRALPRKRIRRRGVIVAALALAALAALVWLRSDPPVVSGPGPGSPAWAREHYGNPDAPAFRTRNITTIDFLGRTMFVHRKAARHFVRLERLFAARAPEYAAAVAAGELDDWSYENRLVRGAVEGKSNHAFGIAIDVNALSNVLGTAGDMPVDVVRQWELEGGDWGGDWARPDPMHFETHLTPEEIKTRYRRDGTPKDWYLQELIGGKRD